MKICEFITLQMSLSLIHVSANYRGHLQGVFLGGYITKNVETSFRYKMLFYVESLNFMLKYKILIKLFVLDCVTEGCPVLRVSYHHPSGVVLLCLPVALYSMYRLTTHTV